MLTASLDLGDFRAEVEKTRRIIKLGIARGVGKAAAEGAQEAKRSGRFKNRTGALRQGIAARFLSDSGGSVEWEILSPARYSKFIEEGTRPHEIRPKNAQALRFVVGGRVVFAGKVRHPGTQADPFMGQAYTKGYAVLVRELEQMTENVANIWR
ncbi:MAG: HK97 gp10 family phage protein [Gemmatimonadaceae bacterium]|nr:HK97 gp10 family phage protein [Gemmatimonadaceae bacterium]